jgi:DNA-binding winged helix-turn-helix (wHTH) protein
VWKKYRFDDFLFDGKSHELSRAGEPIALSPKTAVLLAALVDAAGEALSKAELLERVWPDAVVGEDSLRVRVNELRKALGDTPGEARFIGTVRRHGYRFVAKTKDASDRSPEPWARPSLAVLPFTTSDPDETALTVADGLCAALVATLTRWQELPVVAPPLGPRRKGGPTDARLAGHTLGAAFAIDGRVQIVGGQTRVFYEFVKTESGERLGAGHFDYQDVDPLEIQDQAAARIFNAFRHTYTRVGAPPGAPDEGPGTAWDLATRGIRLLEQATPESCVGARELFLDALELDPLSASIHTDLVITHMLDLVHAWVDEPDLSIHGMVYHTERAHELAHTNYDIGSLAMAHSLKGDHEAARACFPPSNEEPHIEVARAWTELMDGQLDRALALATQAVDWYADAEFSDLAYLVHASITLATGDLETALSSASKAAAQWPSWATYLRIATIHGLADRPDQARRALEKSRALRPALALSDVEIAFRFNEPGAAERYRPVLAGIGLRD